MAQKIIDKYSLDVNALDFDQQQEARDREEIKAFGYAPEAALDEIKYLKPWMVRLATAVCRANSCHMLYRRYDSFQDGRARGARFQIVGRTSDANAARCVSRP